MRREHDETARLLQAWTSVRAALQRKGPRMSFRVPTEEDQVPGVWMMAELHQVFGDFLFPPVRMRKKSFGFGQALSSGL